LLIEATPDVEDVKRCSASRPAGQSDISNFEPIDRLVPGS
jgi:hypothetical protein